MAAVVGLSLALVGCSAGSAPQPTSEQASSPARPAPGAVPAKPAPTRGHWTWPLALAVHVRRPPLDIDLPEARRLVAGRRVTWADLGQRGGVVRVVTGVAGLRAVAQDRDALAVVPAPMLLPTVRAVRVDGLDPLLAPDRYPLRAPAPGAPGSPTTVTVVGDLMFGRRVGAAGHLAALLRPMHAMLAGSDLTVGNLESTLSTAGAPRQGTDSFAADPRVLPVLKSAGFDLLTLANNHTGDYGPVAFRQTLRRVDRSGIARVGAGLNAAAAWRSVVLRANGVRFGFVAFNAIGETPRATSRRAGAAEVRMQPRTGPLNSFDVRRLTRTIHRLAARTDVVVALPHWGEQYTAVPVADQRRVGAAMIDAGADIVVGGHPHWVQGVLVHRRHLVVSSLGNFVFDMDFSAQTREGVTVRLTCWGGRVVAVDFQPYWIGADFAPRPSSGARAHETLRQMWRASDPPFSG